MSCPTSSITCSTWKHKTVRIPRKMKNFMFPPGIKLKKERIVLKLVERWSSKMTSFRKIQTTESVIWILKKSKLRLSQHTMKLKLTLQGHPTSIFGKYLFGGRFEIYNFRNICCNIFCLPASPRIFQHLKNGIIAHF